MTFHDAVEAQFRVTLVPHFQAVLKRRLSVMNRQ